jgi:hypothetical protein
VVCGTALGKKFIKATSLGNPKDNCGIGNTFNQGRIRLKQKKGILINWRLLSQFFQPSPVSPQWMFSQTFSNFSPRDICSVSL